MKNKIIYISELIFSILFIAYDFTIIALCPGTFFANLTSFSHIWSLLGLILFLCFRHRFLYKHSILEKIKKLPKLILGSLITLSFIFSLVNLAFILNPSVTANPSADYVILLGGGVGAKQDLPEFVKTRCVVTAQYLKANPNAIVVVTGGKLKNLPPEAPSLQKFLMEQGISQDRILLEDKAKDTIQNFIFSCQLLAQHQNVSNKQILQSEVLIITSNFHLRRAERLANRLGYTSITGVGTKIPAINALHIYVREICAYIKLNLRILLTGKPSPISE